MPLQVTSERLPTVRVARDGSQASVEQWAIVPQIDLRDALDFRTVHSFQTSHTEDICETNYIQHSW